MPQKVLQFPVAFPGRQVENVCFPIEANGQYNIAMRYRAGLWSQSPAKRRHPDERRSDVEQRDNVMFANWLHSDKIEGNEQLLQNADKHLSGDWNFSLYDDNLVFYIVHVVTDVPCIKTGLSVMRDLSISPICVCGERVDLNKYIWVMGDGGKLDRWSKLSALF